MSVPVLSWPLVAKRNPHCRNNMSTAEAAHRSILADSRSNQCISCPTHQPVPASAETPKLLSPARLTRPSEPILFPKVRIYFADFPYLHCSKTKGLNLGDLLRIWVRSDRKIYHSPGFSRDDKSAPDTAKSAVLYGSHYPISLQ